MRLLKLSVFFSILFILQSVVISRIDFFGGKADFLLIFTILAGVLFGPIEGVLFGALSGFIIDSASCPYYLHIFSRALIGFFAGILKQQIFKDDELILVILVFALSALTYILEIALLGQFFDKTIGNFIKPLLISSILNMLMAFVVNRGMAKIVVRVGIEL